MAWIKRNLFFFIGSLLALALIGLGGWYFYTEFSAERESAQKIGEDYDTLRQLNQLNPNPGKAGGQVDNVQAAKDQQAAVRAWIEGTRAFFQPIKPIGNGDNFPSQLDNTVVQLQRKAAEDGVTLPPSYYFTFQAQKNMLTIPYNVLPQLASRLGEIKVICGLLFDAKITALESVRREALSSDDTNAPDYLPASERTIITPMAEMTPYEVTFDCFSGELASVLGSFAASPHGLVVKTIEVAPAEGGSSIASFMSQIPVAAPEPEAPAPVAVRSANPAVMGGPNAAFFDSAGQPLYRPQRSTYTPPPQQAMSPASSTPRMPTPPPPNGRPVKFLGENKLRITLLVEVVKSKQGK